MPLTLPEPNAPAPHVALPPRPALLEPPDEVRDAVAPEEARLQGQGLAVSPEARKRMLDDWALRYYFRDLPGVDVAYRPTERRVEASAIHYWQV
jgi:hypothetical protein